MPKLNSEELLPFSSEQIASLVLDINRYQEFLPWCKASNIIMHGDSIIIADLTLEYKFIEQKYRSKVEYSNNEENYIINVTAIEGPFRYLYNKWEIKQTSNIDESLVKFTIDFALPSGIINLIAEKLFIEATEKIIDAFRARAISIYKQ